MEIVQTISQHLFKYVRDKILTDFVSHSTTDYTLILMYHIVFCRINFIYNVQPISVYGTPKLCFAYCACVSVSDFILLCASGEKPTRIKIIIITTCYSNYLHCSEKSCDAVHSTEEHIIEL